ncbi:MAG: dihydropteroate synthase, partial [Planctomycetes bacterium]|nr:dihydropteroate synthase [Planctomycetota bacterium]
MSHWRMPTGTLRFGRQPLLMGVVNVTPDSFSDGGQFFDPQAAIDHALQMAADGADILDVGGQSTRPGSAPVDAHQE